MSNIRITGNIGKAPETRYSKSGTPVLEFSMALYTGKDKDGVINPPVWVKVSAWGELVDLWGAALAKGEKVTVTGWMSMFGEPWKKADGTQMPGDMRITAKEIVRGNMFAEPTPEPIGEEELPF